MSHFEKITRIDDSLNGHASREKVFNIEMSDEEYRDRVLLNKTVKEMQQQKQEENDTKVIDIRGKSAKNQSKSPKKKPGKGNSGRNKKSVESLEE